MQLCFRIVSVSALLIAIGTNLLAQSPEYPTYMGDKERSNGRHDARHPWIIGTHAYGVFRAHNQDSTHDKNGRGYRFNHHPNLVFWKDHYWINYQGGPTDASEGDKPRVPYWISYSSDGQHWEAPELLFPSIKFQGENTYMHSRMGFYVAEDGRLLTISFHGRHPGPNRGGENGVARVVREIYGVKDNDRVDMGPIHALRFNADRNQKNTSLPLYTNSSDQEFVAACEELLNDPLVTQQWYEEDRRPALYTVNEGTPKTGPKAEEEFAAKAFDWYTLPNDRIVGWWKGGAMASSDDGWQTTDSVDINYDRLNENRSAKMWGQRLSDGRYALVYNTGTQPPNPKSVHSWTRTPMLGVASEGGLRYSEDQAVVFGDVSPTRYANPPDVGGLNDNRDSGPQYVRGISETNQHKPNTEASTENLWLTYSVNKQDIWVSEVPLAMRHAADAYPLDDFEGYTAADRLGDWIVISPAWAPVSLASQEENQFARLQDQDPYDYAKMMRVFPPSTTAALQFRLRPHQSEEDTLEVDVTDRHGYVALRLRLSAGTLYASQGDELTTIAEVNPDQWHELALSVDADQQTYSVSVGGEEKLNDASFYEKTEALERLEFRTGGFRMDQFSRLGAWPTYPKTTLPNPDTPTSNAIFDVDDVIVSATSN